MPHFSSEHPGDTYYFSPLGIYVFGIVKASKELSLMQCVYYKEGAAKKRGNNVASLLYKNTQLNSVFSSDKPLKCHNLIMDNCRGQNKNKMIIKFFLMMAELGYY